jgi:hypothetical protein
MAVCLFIVVLAVSAKAQSTNIEFPTAVVSNELRGTIEARDLGDPRLTRHFYILIGTPGDLVLSVESTNLNGDVDLFTAGSLRPLTKLSIFSGLSSTSSSKSVYLRRRESLILRVEARSVNDEPGTYRIRISGGFEAMAEDPAAEENREPVATATRRDDKKVRRVNSAGARVNEPLPEIVASAEPLESSSAPTLEVEKTESEKTTPSEPEPEKPKPTKPARVTRTRPPARATRRRPATPVKKKEEPTPATATETSPPPSVETPAEAPEPVLNPRLIIETRDGVRVERYMSEVRRVTVERGQLIVVTSEGKIERRPMRSVLRVAIEP